MCSEVWEELRGSASNQVHFIGYLLHYCNQHTQPSLQTYRCLGIVQNGGAKAPRGLVQLFDFILLTPSSKFREERAPSTLIREEQNFNGGRWMMPTMAHTQSRLLHVHGVEVMLEDLRGHGRGHTELHRHRCVRASSGHFLLSPKQEHRARPRE